MPPKRAANLAVNDPPAKKGTKQKKKDSSQDTTPDIAAAVKNIPVQQPKKRGRPPKATTESDAENIPPAKRPRKTVKKESSTPVPDVIRGNLPARNVRNHRPALKANLVPVPRRTSKQVAEDREALREAAEEQVEKGKKAMLLLAQMQVDEEHLDDEMEVDNPLTLSAEVKAPGGNSDSDCESFDKVDSSSSDESQSDNLPIKKVSIISLIKVLILSLL